MRVSSYENIDYAELKERIAQRTVKDDATDCHVYVTAVDYEVNPKRAIYIKVNNRTLSLMRLVWEIHHPEDRPLSQAAQVRHKRSCLNKRCINPDHLRLIGFGFTQE